MTDMPHKSPPAPRPPRPAPLISVVVPFYNLREWAGRCMDSLLAQDFSSFEVVCVDDGSTDGTAGLLDSYAPDPRVTVLHKENGGLSDARNFGVRHARGALVAFVDGDDLVAPNYLSSLHGALASTGAELAMCRHREVVPEGLGALEWPSGAPGVEAMGPAEAVSAVLYDRVRLSAWGKLAPREIYLDHPFPEGKFFEDTRMFRWHFASLGSFALVDAPLYAYVKHPGSITGDAHPGEDKVLCHEEAIRSLESDLAGFPEAAGPAADRFIALEFCHLHSEASRARPRTDRMREVMAASRGRVLRAWPGLRRDPGVWSVDKVRLWVVANVPWAHAPLVRAWKLAARARERVAGIVGR